MAEEKMSDKRSMPPDREVNLQELTVEQVEKMDDDELERIGQKKKKKTKRRKFEGNLRYLISAITICMSAYHLYTAIFSISPMLQRSYHLSFVLVLVFLLYPATTKSPVNRPSVIDWFLAALSVVAVSNVILNFKRLASTGGRGNRLDLIFGVITVLLVLECARRTVGLVLPSMAIFLIAYGFFGAYITGPLKHAGFSWKRIIQHLTLTTEGVYGQILGVSSTFIYMFILFGAFLAVTGMSAVFNDISMALAGGARGGPAKVSVLASGLMGSISGSASANVVTTGAFTIPLMRKLGYKDYFASSVEAAASTGGQIMPPVMGSAAFIIADSLGIKFFEVIKAALLPAILYYVSLWIMIDLRARKEKISGLPKEALPKLKEVIVSRGHLLIPLFGIIFMLVSGYNAMRAAVIGIVLSVVCSFFRKDTWIKPLALLKAMESGALSALSVAAACAVIGILIGMVSLTGAILAMGAAILKLSGGMLALTLILTMMTATILGMGLPTTACYVLTSTIAAPAIVQLGVPPLAAHLFVFYYGILSAITPPVATAAYTAAGLSGANPNRTGFSAVRLAATGFIIPFMFVYSPELLLPAGLSVLLIIRVICTSLIGVFALSLAIEGYYERHLNLFERVACAAAAILLIDSGIVTDCIGIGIVAVVWAGQRFYTKKMAAA
ncbi:C4-dicarboxylate ABC transporter [Eubacteriales bacterium]|nr:C4-dicarboxylate ABC transporter [Eubacteriales bacterium]GKH62374.1 C4-dicarboxylate ABC transporter [Eubacteriales bacterium]